jgi:hypothetical protein
LLFKISDFDSRPAKLAALTLHCPRVYSFITLLSSEFYPYLTGEDFLEINQSETRIVCGGHVC